MNTGKRSVIDDFTTTSEPSDDQRWRQADQLESRGKDTASHRASPRRSKSSRLGRYSAPLPDLGRTL
jgi:hypothetical protein